MARVLIAGCGYVGQALGRRLSASGDRVWGLRRSGASVGSGILTLAADLVTGEGLEKLPEELDSVVFAAAPDRRDEAAYRQVYVEGLARLIERLARRDVPRRLFFVSSTGVYGQTAGEWVDEDSPTNPVGFSGRCMLDAERVARDAPIPSTIVRLGGIYGPGRGRLIAWVRERRPWPPRPPKFTNRIHREDAAGILAHLMSTREPADRYVGVDREPAPLHEVLDWIARELGIEPAPSDPDAPSPGPGSKRCRSDRLVSEGYVFEFPSFREGYGAMLDRP